MSGLRLVFTKYNLNDSHDVSKALGGLGFSIVIAAVGVSLLVQSRNKK